MRLVKLWIRQYKGLLRMKCNENDYTLLVKPQSGNRSLTNISLKTLAYMNQQICFQQIIYSTKFWKPLKHFKRMNFMAYEVHFNTYLSTSQLRNGTFKLLFFSHIAAWLTLSLCSHVGPPQRDLPCVPHLK